jgi:LPXTG-motif cell wall-anchored protein
MKFVILKKEMLNRNINETSRKGILTMKKSLLASLGVAGMGIGALLAVSVVAPASATATLPSTDHIYAYDCTDGASDFQLLELSADGSATAIGTGMGTTVGDCPVQPAYDWKTGKAYFIFQTTVYATDLTTGVTTAGPTTSGAGVAADLKGTPYLAIAPDGTAFVQTNGYQGTIDLASGVVTQFPSTYNRDQGAYYIMPFAYNGVDSLLYAINADNTTNDAPPYPNQLSVMSQATGDINFPDGGVTIPGYQNEDITELYAMAFDSSGLGWLIRTDVASPPISKLLSIDVATGTVVEQGNLVAGANPVNAYSIFIASPTPSLPDTGANSGINLGAVVGIGAGLLMAGAVAFVIARRRTA